MVRRWQKADSGALAANGCACRDFVCRLFYERDFQPRPGGSVELLAKLIGYGFERIVLPFIGAANLGSIQEAKEAFRTLSAFAGNGVELAVESTLPAEALRTSLEGKPLSVCYDLGNTTALGL